MARLDGKFIKGTAGPVVYKKYRDRQIVQSSPIFRDGSQTTESKKAAAGFGQASRLARNIRDQLNSIITENFDGPMVNRMNSELIYVLRQSLNTTTQTYEFNSDSFNRLDGFEFNINSPVRDFLFVEPTVTIAGTELTISFPEIQIPKELKFLKDSTTCVIGLAIGMFDLKHGHMDLSPIKSAEAKYTFQSSVIPAGDFTFQIEPGCLLISAVSLQFIRTTFAGKMALNNKNYNPVAILNATIADGTPNWETTRKWAKMGFETG